MYDDYREGVVKSGNRPAAARTADTNSIVLGTFGAHYLQNVRTTAGPIDLLLWGAWQTGLWGTLSHRAVAVAVESGWQPSVLSRIRLWLRGGYDYGSGDSDSADRMHGTFFQLLPTPRIYARFPFYNMMNTADAFAQLVARPGARVTVRGDIHQVRLAEAHDLWYSGGGAFQPQTFGYVGRPSGGQDSLATLSDASVEYVINPHLAVTAYGGYASGGSVTRTIYPGASGAVFGYVETLIRF